MKDVIDLKDALERVQDDKELLLELFDIFMDDFVGKYAQLKEAQQRNDCAAFQMLAHGLKGATGNISAMRMHENCTELDAKGKICEITGLGPAVELLGQQFQEFKVEAERVRQQFGK